MKASEQLIVLVPSLNLFFLICFYAFLVVNKCLLNYIRGIKHICNMSMDQGKILIEQQQIV